MGCACLSMRDYTETGFLHLSEGNVSGACRSLSLSAWVFGVVFSGFLGVWMFFFAGPIKSQAHPVIFWSIKEIVHPKI